MIKNYEIIGKDAKEMIESEINLKKPVNLQMMQTDINNQDFIMN